MHLTSFIDVRLEGRMERIDTRKDGQEDIDEEMKKCATVERKTGLKCAMSI